MTNATSFYQFWLEYLKEHELLATRLWHFVGTSAAIIAGLLAVVAWNWVYLIIAIVVAYGSSLLAHLMVEHNRPVTFRHPWWSARADLLLCRMMLTRGLTESINNFKLL